MEAFLKWLINVDPSESGRLGADWSFNLTVPVNGFLKLAMVLAYIALVYLTIRSYRREGHNPVPVKVLLAAIRIAVLSLVFMILLQPSIVWRITKTVRKSVVVLVDDSQSMANRDGYADPKVKDDAEKLEKFLGVSQPELNKVSRVEIVRKVLGRSDGAISKLSKDLNIEVRGFPSPSDDTGHYGRQLGKLEISDEKGQSPATQPVGMDKMLDKLTAGGFETNLNAALRDGYEALQGKLPAGLVVVSDFQMTTPGATGRLQGTLTYGDQRGIPRYCLLVGDPTPPKNVAVTSLEAPEEVWANTGMELVATVAHRNMEGQTVTVKLMSRSKSSSGPTTQDYAASQPTWLDTGVSQQVTLAKSGESTEQVAAGAQKVSLRITPKDEGTFEYMAVIDPLAGENQTADNSARTTVQVSNTVINVLLISGDAGWEFQYLKNLLIRQMQTDDKGQSRPLYNLSVWQQNADPSVSQAASTDTEDGVFRLAQLPRTLDKVVGVPGDKTAPGYKAVILYDPEPTEGGFDPEFVSQVLKPYVEQRNGGLCYIAGSKNTENTFKNEAYKELRDMLPVVLGNNDNRRIAYLTDPHPDPWQIQLTAYGREHQVTRLARSADDSMKEWEILPGIFWSHAVAQVKPLARILAENSDPKRRLGTKTTQAEPLIVVQPYGNGRVMYLGCDESWRWRMVKDGELHQRYWNNILRYMASLKARQVIITTGGDVFDAGKEINVTVEAYGDDAKPLSLKGETYKVDMLVRQEDGSGKVVHTIDLKPVMEPGGKIREGWFQGTIPPEYTRTSGEYELTSNELRLKYAADPDKLAQRVAAKVVKLEKPRAEAIKSEADPDTMANIASKPEYAMKIFQVEDLLTKIAREKLRADREQTDPLWDTNMCLMLIVLLLVAEWIIRKVYNMA
ncbi:MAG: hypothetical protein HZA50_09260 [Planctomycetes bacterium]|nr:hypothetical protein [Planctomycetota bacterium]